MLINSRQGVGLPGRRIGEGEIAELIEGLKSIVSEFQPLVEAADAVEQELEIVGR
jgi:hypothetical protein